MELKAHPFFKQMDKESVDTLTRAALVQNLPRGTVIFEEGDISDSIYLVLDGTIGFGKKIPWRLWSRRGQWHLCSCWFPGCLVLPWSPWDPWHRRSPWLPCPCCCPGCLARP